MRLGSAHRGLLIAVLIGFYSWLFKRPQASFTEMFLIGAGVQLAVIAMRKFVPPSELPRALDMLETLADGVTVLLFAIGIYGGIVRMPADL